MASLASRAMPARRWRTDGGSASWRRTKIATRCRTSCVTVPAPRSCISAPSATLPLSPRDSTPRFAISMRPAWIAFSCVAFRVMMALLLRFAIVSVVRPLPDSRLPLFIELGAQNQRHHQAITAHTGFDAVRLEVLVVHLPTGALQQRPPPATQTLRDVLDVTARAGLEHRCQQHAIGSAHLATQLPVEKQPSAVLRARIALHAGEPPDEIRPRLIGIPSEMGPLVRGDERPLDRQQIRIRHDLECERIDHPVHTPPAKIQSVDGPLETTRDRGRTVGQKPLRAFERAAHRLISPWRGVSLCVRRLIQGVHLLHGLLAEPAYSIGRRPLTFQDETLAHRYPSIIETPHEQKHQTR